MGRSAQQGSALALPGMGPSAPLGTEPAAMSPGASAGPGHPPSAFSRVCDRKEVVWCPKWLETLAVLLTRCKGRPDSKPCPTPPRQP